MNFAILWHQMPPHAARASHWDLLVETDPSERLWTWELLEEPVLGREQPARRLADHRRDYLSYEGPLTNDRGDVVQWETGQLEWVERRDDRLVAILMGRRMTAQLTLTRHSGDTWIVRFDGRS